METINSDQRDSGSEDAVMAEPVGASVTYRSMVAVTDHVAPVSFKMLSSSSAATTIEQVQQQQQSTPDPGSTPNKETMNAGKKRGMKPRSKRNRKRARSQLNGVLMQENGGFSSSSQMMVKPEITIQRLELDGRPIYNNSGKDGESPMLLRTIRPYPYCFATFAKARWLKRSILDVYSTEFGSYPGLYYESAIRQGRILVNDQKVACDYIIKGGDVLSHVVHRHEPSVLVSSPTAPWVTIVEETDDVVVVDKPATLPIHPCGGYHLQCLMNVLENRHYDKDATMTKVEEEVGSTYNNEDDDDDDDYNDNDTKGKILQATTATKLYTIHRLDRLTSGLVILGKTSKVAQKWGKCIQQRSCQKVYLARVAGKFPLNMLARNHNNAPIKINDEEQDFSGGNNQERPKVLLKRLKSTTSLVGIPLHGEWPIDHTSRNENDCERRTAGPALQARERNAYTYWVSDSKGKFISNSLFEDGMAVYDDSLLLQRVFESQHGVDKWLDSIGPNAYPDSVSSSMLWLHLACPTRIAQQKDGICEAGMFFDLNDSLYIRTVKPAHTSFGVVSYDQKTDSTLLICRPYTGRTHQIRIHLQHLGHSIANDPNYGGHMWYGNSNGYEACRIAEERLNVINISEEMSVKDPTKPSYSGSSTTTTMTTAIDVPATEKEILNGICSMVQEEGESIHDFVKRTCVWCERSNMVGGADRAVLEFLIRSPGIWLHALQYSFEVAEKDADDTVGTKTNNEDSRSKMTYRAPLPPWYTLSRKGG